MTSEYDMCPPEQMDEVAIPRACPIIVPPQVLEILISWLKYHEDDIANEINDFGELKLVYEALFSEMPSGMQDKLDRLDSVIKLFEKNEINSIDCLCQMIAIVRSEGKE